MDPVAQSTPNPIHSEPAQASSQPIPTVDLKAPLKIEDQQQDDAPKVNYGDKLFVVGIMFCVVIAICVGLVSFFLTTTNNQTQQVVTVKASK